MTLPLRADSFRGKHFSGEGDRAFLQSLDDAYSMLRPSATTACLPMLYRREWNGFVEGPTWDAWWIQNSFGPSYTMMPFLQEPYLTWVANSQALWFLQMADGKRADQNGYVAPAGCLCDAATPHLVYYRQGDGQVAIHDWCIGFTTAGLILECELMLIRRDRTEIKRLLPKLEAVAGFLDSRRDRRSNLLLGGVASNLLAPSYGGWLQPDGKRGKAYLAELSVNYVAAMDRLVEVCKLAGQKERAALYAGRGNLVRKALPQLQNPDGTFIQALNPDGTRQGVYGAKEHGFFESAPNHDALCFRIADDSQARRIYAAIRGIPELRPHDLILPNYPSYDSMYESRGLFDYGVWVNGGHWTTAEARMIMGYYRVGAQADAERAFHRIRDLAQAYRADNNLTDRGAKLYQPAQPYNVVYDCWGAPGGMLRGLFEYVYGADGVRLYPHLPSGVDRVAQHFPIWLGGQQVYVSAAGHGPITEVRVNGKQMRVTDATSYLLKAQAGTSVLEVQLLSGGAKPFSAQRPAPAKLPPLSSIRTVFPFAQPRSGNRNPLRIGLSSQGTHGFVGEVRAVAILRREVGPEAIRSAMEGRFTIPPQDFVARFALDQPLGATVAGGPSQTALAHWVGPKRPTMADGGLSLDGRSCLELPASFDVDLQTDFTLMLWCRPAELPQAGSRLIDHCTVGAADGYNLDFIDGGKKLRLIHVTGVVEAAVDLRPGVWVHVAGTCDSRGLMRLYLNGTCVAEKLGKVPSALPEAPSIESVWLFASLLGRQGLGTTYAAAHAGLALEMGRASVAHRRLASAGRLAPPHLPGIPPAKLSAVESLYADTVDRLVGGLADYVASLARSTNARDRAVVAAARQSGLILARGPTREWSSPR